MTHQLQTGRQHRKTITGASVFAMHSGEFDRIKYPVRYTLPRNKELPLSDSKRPQHLQMMSIYNPLSPKQSRTDRIREYGTSGKTPL